MKRFYLSLVAVLVLVLAGCGGGSSHHTSKHQSPTVALRAAHPCSPSGNYYMQCATGAKGATKPKNVGVGSSALFGIDFAWGGPWGSTARSFGARFGVSYLSGTSKDWSYSLAHSYSSAGLGVLFVFETTASRSLSGCAGGAYDARRASSEQASLGFAGAPIFFATDFDTSGFSYHGSVGEYYRCARSIIGNRAGVYGGLQTIRIAQANGYPSSRLWQTLAWSYGTRTSACLYQYSINNTWHGYGVDYNLAFCSDYGQYHPGPPPPPPGPSKKQLSQWRGARNSSLNAYHHRRCTRPVLTKQKGCTTYAKRVVRYQHLLEKKYKRVHCWGRGAPVDAPICQIVRPEVHVWNNAIRSTNRAYFHRNCNGIATFGTPSHTKACNRLRSRRTYFENRITQVMKSD